VDVFFFFHASHVFPKLYGETVVSFGRLLVRWSFPFFLFLELSSVLPRFPHFWPTRAFVFPPLCVPFFFLIARCACPHISSSTLPFLAIKTALWVEISFLLSFFLPLRLVDLFTFLHAFVGHDSCPFPEGHSHTTSLANEQSRGRLFFFFFFTVRRRKRAVCRLFFLLFFLSSYAWVVFVPGTFPAFHFVYCPPPDIRRRAVQSGSWRPVLPRPIPLLVFFPPPHRGLVGRRYLLLSLLRSSPPGPFSCVLKLFLSLLPISPFTVVCDSATTIQSCLPPAPW